MKQKSLTEKRFAFLNVTEISYGTPLLSSIVRFVSLSGSLIGKYNVTPSNVRVSPITSRILLKSLQRMFRLAIGGIKSTKYSNTPLSGSVSNLM